MADTQADVGTYILFSVAGTAYGLRSTDVQHVEMIEQITRVPNAPGFVDGVVFSRGQVVPAVNLRVRFGFDRSPFDMRTRLIVVRNGERQVGLIVDEAREFLKIPGTAVQPPNAALTGASTKYIAGIATLNDRMVVILDLGAILDFTDSATAA